jgi:hypothetical protein
MMRTSFSFDFGGIRNQQPRKLSLKKETLRQLTDGQLRQVAGGGVSISIRPSTSISPSSSMSSGTSVISPSTSANPSGG